MPYIEVKIAQNSLPEDKAIELSSGMTDVMTNTLNKKRALVSVSIETIKPARWFVAETSIAKESMTTAFVSARITQGTNTKEEKAKAIQEIADLLNESLGVMAEASYIVLDEIPATDWGYSGKTQESRKATIKRQDNQVIDTQHYMRQAHQLRGECIYSVFNRLVNSFKRFIGQPKLH